MTTRHPRRFGVERLEARELLSGAVASVQASATPKGAVMPYAELTLKGHFVAGAPTTVTFAAKHGGTITVTPSLVTKSAVVVAVPALFDPATGQPVAGSASVSVDQTVRGHAKVDRVIKGLSIARLPQAGLMAGDVLGAVTVAASSVTSDAEGRFARIAQDPGRSPGVRQGAAEVEAALGEIGLLIPQAQQQLVALAFGTVASVPLGMYQGRPATLDVGQLALLDRIVAAGIDDAAGTTSRGVALVQSLDNIVSGAALAGPRAVIGRAKEVVDVLGTATGSPVIPPGAVATGLAIGSLSAVVAAAEAEALLIQETPGPPTHSGTPDLALVDQVLDDPALGLALGAITSGLVPTTPAGQALIQAAQLAEGLAALIDPNVPGSLGAQYAS